MSDARNEDWLRTIGWDLPTTLDAFLASQGNDPERLRHFLTLPAAEAMPEDLRGQVENWLHEH